MSAGPSLVLSIFPGIDLLGRGFEEEGFCVVRGPDIVWGGDIRRFHPPRCVTGVIGGSPCQDFSSLRRDEPSGLGLELLGEFARVVSEAGPDWFLLENVPRVPTIAIEGYSVQRFNLKASECGAKQARLRSFQFGRRGLKQHLPLVIRRRTMEHVLSPAAIASEGNRKGRRGWAEFCQLQGLPPDFDLPGMTKEAKYRAVGNGVPIPMGRVIAQAIRAWTVTPANALLRVCVCDCGREVRPGQTMATAACRKRMERKRRDSAGVTGPGSVTPSQSQLLLP